MGFKIWWSWKWGFSNFKIPIGRTVFCFLCVNFIFCGAGCSFWVKKCKNLRFLIFCSDSFLIGGASRQGAAQPPRARRSRRQGGGAAAPNRLGRGSRSDPLPSWLWSEVKWVSEWVSECKSLPRSILPRVSTPFPAGRRERGTRYDSPKLIVKWMMKWNEMKWWKQILGLEFLWNFYMF